MAVYGIGAVIKLIEHIDDLERALEAAERTGERFVARRPRTDPMVERILESTGTGFPLPPPPKKKRKATAASKRYGKAFKKIQHRYKKKNGSWKKDGFKRCAAAARRMAKK